MKPLSGALAAFLLAVSLSSCGGAAVPAPSPPVTLSSWLQGSGNDLHNNRWQSSETIISPANVASLAPKWATTVAGDVSATPTTDGTTVYFPDWGGFINAVDAETGAVIWQKAVPSFNGVAASYSRTSP